MYKIGDGILYISKVIFNPKTIKCKHSAKSTYKITMVYLLLKMVSEYLSEKSQPISTVEWLKASKLNFSDKPNRHAHIQHKCHSSMVSTKE